MGRRYTKQVTLVSDGFECDNKKCPQPIMDCDAYTLQGGYGSTCMDGDEFVFCSLQCIREWLSDGPFATVQN